MTVTVVVKGGPTSGNFGHKGRTGQVGGSSPRDSSAQAYHDIQQMIDQFAEFGSKNPKLKYNNYYDFLKKHGKFFDERVPLPKGCKKGMPKQCYRNSFNNMSEDLLYTEGLVFLKKIPIPIEHAWLTTKDGKVIDPTLPADDEAYYFGVQFNPGFVMDRAFETNYPGVMANDYMAKRSIMEHGLPKGALYEETVEKGGSGSGNFGHAGRPGEVGGSAPSKHGGMNNDIASIIAMEEDDFVEKKYTKEHLAIIGSDGKPLANEIGSLDTVHIPDKPIGYYKDSVLTHVHPPVKIVQSDMREGKYGFHSSMPPSPSDVLAAIQLDMKEVRTITFDAKGKATLYRMRKPEGGWPKLSDMKDGYNYYIKNFPNTVKKMYTDSAEYSHDLLEYAHNQAVKDYGFIFEKVDYD